MGNRPINGVFVELSGRSVPQARSFDAPAPMQKRIKTSSLVVYLPWLGNSAGKVFRDLEVDSLQQLVDD